MDKELFDGGSEDETDDDWNEEFEELIDQVVTMKPQTVPLYKRRGTAKIAKRFPVTFSDELVMGAHGAISEESVVATVNGKEVRGVVVGNPAKDPNAADALAFVPLETDVHLIDDALTMANDDNRTVVMDAKRPPPVPEAAVCTDGKLSKIMLDGKMLPLCMATSETRGKQRKKRYRGYPVKRADTVVFAPAPPKLERTFLEGGGGIWKDGVTGDDTTTKLSDDLKIYIKRQRTSSSKKRALETTAAETAARPPPLPTESSNNTENPFVKRAKIGDGKAKSKQPKSKSKSTPADEKKGGATPPSTTANNGETPKTTKHKTPPEIGRAHV